MEGHDRFFGAHLGEKLPVTETEQGIVRHLEQASGQKEREVRVGARYIHSENMAHYRDMSWR